MKVFNLKVLIEQSEDGNFFIECPSLQGCYT
jgi:predicted RNase H-like HicB family nuclease